MKDQIELPPLPAEFRSANSVPVERATITQDRMREILQAAIEADRQANNLEPLTPAEAVFAFAGWLTGRSDPVTLSSRHGAAIAVDLAVAFNESQGLHRFREHFHKHIKPYPAEKDRQARGEPVAYRYTEHDAVRYVSNPKHMSASAVDAGIVPEPLFSSPQPTALVVKDSLTAAEPVNGEELLAAREALIDMGYLWDGDQWVEVDPPSKTVEQAPEWPDFARMEASLQRLKERLVFENSRRNDLEQKLREKRNG